MGFPAKSDHFGVFGGYIDTESLDHLWKERFTSSKDEETFGKVYVKSLGGWVGTEFLCPNLKHFISYNLWAVPEKIRKILYKVGRGSSFEWSELWGPS